MRISCRIQLQWNTSFFKGATRKLCSESRADHLDWQIFWALIDPI
uniref:Uncharacterized protein n=1 Tax=Curvibacter symbiont subsp. Hydra magnipapillata TaxID=667019 RepID=C9YAK2_CURXX|nr:hypothetical protein Csp_A11530 [Curvibacter putative symbiont of Hydra magnipapillata]